MRKSTFAEIALALVLASSASRADDEIPNILPPPDHGARTLRGHTFIEPATQETAFVTSHVGLRQGVAYFSIPKFPIYANRKADLAIFALEERLDLQVRILPWLGLYGAGEAVLATGLDQSSLFYGSTGFLAGGRGGPVVRLYQSRDSGTQVTIRGVFGGGAGNSLALPGFVQAVASRANQEVAAGLPSPVASPNDLATRFLGAVSDLSNAALADTTYVEYGGSVAFAQTIVSMVGFQAGFQVRRRDTVDTRFDGNLGRRAAIDGTEDTLRFGAAPSVDFYHVRVPVAVVAEYAVEKSYRSFGPTSVYVPSGHYFGGGIYYSGRTDLQLGMSAFVRRNLKPLQVTSVDGTTAETGVPTELHGQLVLRYVWN